MRCRWYWGCSRFLVVDFMFHGGRRGAEAREEAKTLNWKRELLKRQREFQLSTLIFSNIWEDMEVALAVPGVRTGGPRWPCRSRLYIYSTIPLHIQSRVSGQSQQTARWCGRRALLGYAASLHARLCKSERPFSPRQSRHHIDGQDRIKFLSKAPCDTSVHRTRCCYRT
jgi:hypothetical protein